MKIFSAISVMLLLAFQTASAEEKYPKVILVEIEVLNCKGNNLERLEISGKLTREKEIFLYKLPRTDRWVPKTTLEPKNYVFRNTGKKTCQELLKNRFNLFERVQKDQECTKKPRAHWWCSYASYNLLGDPSEYSAYF